MASLKPFAFTMATEGIIRGFKWVRSREELQGGNANNIG